MQATALLFAGFETLLSCTAAATAARQCSAASAQAGPLAPHAALVRSTAFRDSFTDEIADARCAPVLQVGSFCFSESSTKLLRDFFVEFFRIYVG